MQTSKKRIYGALGLATVAGMTIVAHSIPAPEAYAETSSDVELKVTVMSNNLDLKITGSIRDGSATSDSPVTIPILVTDVKYITIDLKATQGDSASHTFPTRQIDLADTGTFSGTYDLELDLEQLKQELVDDYGFDATQPIKFALEATGHGYGSGVASDGIAFSYGSVTIDPTDNIDPTAPDDETNVHTNDKGDPVINVGIDDKTETIHVVVRDDETGEVVWEGDFSGDDIRNNDGKITLPFAENGIPSGNYTIEVYAYDVNGNLIGVSSLSFRYIQPDGAGIPNTGGVTIAGLNIARADFLISSALVFCLVSLGGIYLLSRRTRKQ